MDGIKGAFRCFGWTRIVRTDWFDGGCAPPNPAPLAAAGVRGEHLETLGGSGTDCATRRELARGLGRLKRNGWIKTTFLQLDWD